MNSSSSSSSKSREDGLQRARPDEEEHGTAQVDEVLALSQIYADEFQLLSARRGQQGSNSDDGGGDLEDDGDDDYLAYEHPIRYQIRLSATGSSAAEPGIPKKLIHVPLLEVEYPANYPDAAPRFSLKQQQVLAPGTASDKPKTNLARLEEAIRGAVEVGMPCVMQCVQAGLDFMEQHEEDELVDDDDDDDDKPAAAASEEERADGGGDDDDDVCLLRDALPRPLLLLVLDQCCTAGDRGRLSVSARWLRRLLERRAQRALLSSVPSNRNNGLNAKNDYGDDDDIDDHDEDDWLLGSNGMMVDTVWREPWELDVRRAKEERQISTFHEQLWKRQHSVQLDFSLARGTWRIREGLSPRPVTAPVLSWNTARHCFHYARTTRSIAKQRQQQQWYLVRVRLRALRSNDGDVFVGLVRKSFDRAPAASFGGTEPNSGFGTESEQCALVNVVSGQNAAAGVPLEVNLGLIVTQTDGTVEYGIPIDSYLGRPQFNSGKVSSSLQTTKAEDGGSEKNDDDDDIHIAVVATASTEQTDLFASVTIQECLEKEWKSKMVRPYNTI